MNRRSYLFSSLSALVALAAVCVGCNKSEAAPQPGPAGSATPAAEAKEVTLLNVSYDPTRELYAEYNKLFAERNIGDVLLTWENEAALMLKELGKDKIEVVVPSVSILAEPPVSVVDKVVDKRGTRKAAEEYLSFLYTPEAQELAVKHHYRPRNEEVMKKHEAEFPKLTLFTIDEVFGGWTKAQKTHFDDGGVFDSIYTKK